MPQPTREEGCPCGRIEREEVGMKEPPMDWRMAILLAVVVVGTGCPEEWGKGGFIDRAVRKDIKAGLEHQKICANGLPAEWLCKGDGPAKKCGWECPE